MNTTPIPVTIITGFLGAGKTTLLNHIIKAYPQKKFAIIENEFGEIGIDGGLIVGADNNIFELANGCICCSLSESFYDTINMLLKSQCQFNHLLIETTGIADPDSIIQCFVLYDDIKRYFKIDSVITLADASYLTELLGQQPEARKQIALSDLVLLNKIDMVTPNNIEELTRHITYINPSADVYPVAYANINDLNILDRFTFSGHIIEQKTLAFKGLSMQWVRTVNPPSGINSDKNIVLHDIASEGFVIPGSFKMGAFTLWIEHFLYYNRKTVFRVKGIVSFDNMEERLILHAVRDTYLNELGAPWGNEQRFNKIVFIGKNLDRDKIEDSLYQLLAP
jgi:G3E family GTPase